MGEIAEMMLDGTLCQGCGLFLNEDPPGYPVSCPECRRASQPRGLRLRPEAPKVKCPTCGKRVKAAGLRDHQRDVHSERVPPEVGAS